MVSLTTTQKLILAFITLTLGVVLLPTIATEGNDITNFIHVQNESHDAAYGTGSCGGEGISGVSDGCLNTTETNYTVNNAPTGWKAAGACPITNVVLVRNNSVAMVDGTDYILDEETGVFGLLNTSNNRESVGSDNNTYISYYYCPDDYMNLSWGRTGIKLVPGFFAIALLLASVGLFYSVAKEHGIIGR